MDFEKYFYTKIIQYIVFNGDIIGSVLKGDLDSWLSQENCFEALKDYCDYMIDNDYLEESYKNNLLSLINHIRFLQRKMQASAEMITKVNNCEGMNCDEFYVLAMDYHNLDDQDHYTQKEIAEFKKEMPIIFNLDFIVLSSHTVFDEEAFAEVFEVFVNNPDYYRVIYSFNMECPDIFESAIFLQRFRSVLVMNDFLYSQSDKTEKVKVLKPINDMLLDSFKESDH